MKKLKLTQEGFDKLTRELENKKEELRELGKYKSQAAANEGDTWHDNFAFEQTEINERGLIRQINELQERINTAEVIQDEKVKSSDVVGVGSHVTVSLKFSQEDEEELSFFLTGNFGEASSEYVSINSPIGECIVGKRVGYEGKYTVNGNEIFVKIKSVSN